MFNLLLVIFAAAAVFFLCAVVIGVLKQAYVQYEEQYLAKQATDLEDMFFFIGPRQLMLLTGAAMGIGLVVGLLLLGPIMTVLLVGAGLASPTILVNFYRQRRVKNFERQLVDALGSMASAFRAGMTLFQAMEEIAKTSQAPLSQEFNLTVREIRLGTPSEEALDNLAGRVDSEDLRLVVNGINTARSLGGNMSEMLEKIAATIRERFRIEGRIRALTAQGKLQGIIIGLMPLLVWLGFDMIRPDLTRPMMSHMFGLMLVLCVVVMEILGALFIRRIIAIRV